MRVIATVIAPAALAALAAADLFPDCVNGPLAKNAVCNTSLSVTDRVNGLIGALTVPEKIGLLGSTSPGVSRLGLPSYVWWQEALVSKIPQDHSHVYV